MARSRSHSSSLVALLLALGGCLGDKAAAPAAPPLGGSAPTPPLTGSAPSLLAPNHVGDVPKRDASGAIVSDASGNVLYALPSSILQKIGAGLLAPPSAAAPTPSPRSASARRSSLQEIGGMDVIVLLDIIYGIAVDVSDWVTGSSDKKEALARFDELHDHLGEIDGQVAALGAQMNLQFDQSWAHIDLSDAQLAVFSSSQVLDTYFKGSHTGTLSYYARQASLIEACVNTPGHPAACIPEQRDAYQSTSLKTESAFYAAHVLGTYQISAAVSGIHLGIVPKGNVQILRALARYIATSAQGPSGADPSQQAMAAYLSLEGMFTQLLTYQFQGALMVGNAYNQQDLARPPQTNGQSAHGLNANQYLTGDFEHFLREECVEFLAQVDWLAVNLHDYRNAPAYAVDMAYNGWGLAPDPVFAAPLARSRFFCAQVLAPFNQNRAAGTNGVWSADTTYQDDLAGTDFGLHGVVVLPSGYVDGGTITLQLLDATGAIAATAMATPGKTSLSHSLRGRFPNTLWADFDPQGDPTKRVRLGKATESHDWSVYDFAVPSASLAPGSYTVKLKGSGASPVAGPGPWLYTSATLGQVTIRTYDPANPATGTGSADPLQAVSFGSFSLYWPWGFQPLHSMPSKSVVSSAMRWYLGSNPDDTFSSWPVIPGNPTPVNQVALVTSGTDIESYSVAPYLKLWLGTDPDKTSDSVNVGVMYAGDTEASGHFYWGGSPYMKSASLYSRCQLEDMNGSVKIAIDSAKTSEVSAVYHRLYLSSQTLTYKQAKLNAGGYKFSPVIGYDSKYVWDNNQTPEADASSTLTWHAQILFTDTKLVDEI